MATKKQKREAGRLKHEQEMAELKAQGINAQKRDQQAQKEWRAAMVDMAERINIRHRTIIEKARCGSCGELVAPGQKFHHHKYCLG